MESDRVDTVAIEVANERCIPRVAKVIEVVGCAQARTVLADFPVRVESSGYSIHIIDATVTKGTGVKHALNLIDIPIREVMVLGDSENDISMFELAGLSVAVSPKDEALTSMADYVCKWTDGDGVFEAVSKILGPP